MLFTLKNGCFKNCSSKNILLRKTLVFRRNKDCCVDGHTYHDHFIIGYIKCYCVSCEASILHLIRHSCVRRVSVDMLFPLSPSALNGFCVHIGVREMHRMGAHSGPTVEEDVFSPSGWYCGRP